MFSLAKQLGYFDGVNPVQDTRVDPTAAEPAETYAYSLEEVQSLLALPPEPAATAFAVAAFMGLRVGELEALRWEDYRDGEMHISRSIWNGRIGPPKTRKSAAPVPVIRQIAERLEMHRFRSHNPQSGPIFSNSLGNPMSMNNLLGRVIGPTLNRCARCGKSKGKLHVGADHDHQRDVRLPQWHGWHAARRGLGSNLYRLGVPPMVIQRILRHSNVNTTANYYIKTAAGDVRDAMAKLEKTVTENLGLELRDTFGTLQPILNALPESVN
jgi:integrase